MATIDVTRLFPPIIATYLPAKDILSINDNSSSCPQGVGGIEIPFDINQLNNINDIKEIHISITRQSNYQSLFNSNDYPMGIYILSADNNIKTNKSFIVPNNVLNKDQLNFNEYYKIQLRFSSDSNGHSKTGQTLSNYLLNESYMAKFSEWSTVSLLRFVAKPTISLQGNLKNSKKTLVPGGLNSLDGHYLNLTGKFTKSGDSRVLGKDFKNANDSEYLSSWRIKVFIGETGTEILDSGVQQVNYRGSNLDEIKYNVPCYFDKDVNNYRLVLYITTANLYTVNFTYYIKTTSSENSWGSQSEIAEYTSLDSVIGKVNITFEPVGNTTVPAGGSIIIRRASDKDNFGYWEPIWSKNSIPELKPGDSIIYDDFTIESGVIYKYNIAYTKTINNETETYSITEGPILSIFDNAFLTGENTQLCVKFNPNISSFKVNVSDNIVNTIGGKYPIINRNSNMYYRSFSLSGTIAYEMDAEHQFATRSSIYGEWINVYGTYFVNRYINAQNDRITQRKFRELVMSYLYDDVPKLFRSTPEGNILVRLTDITLSPKQELGRMIYDFSCTATEIGDCNIDNYKIYQIQDFGDI